MMQEIGKLSESSRDILRDFKGQTLDWSEFKQRLDSLDASLRAMKVS
jgi:hypothetical protein